MISELLENSYDNKKDFFKSRFLTLHLADEILTKYYENILEFKPLIPTLKQIGNYALHFIHPHSHLMFAIDNNCYNSFHYNCNYKDLRNLVSLYMGYNCL